MSRLLKDAEIRKFSEMEEVKSFFQEQKESDVWIDPSIAEMKVQVLENAPIILDERKKAYGLESLGDDTVTETMEGTGLMLNLPLNGKRMNMPVRDTAFGSICKRAGLSGTTLTKAYSDHKEVLMDILNEGFGIWDNKTSQVLIRDEKISAAHSQKYSVLPTIDLLDILTSKLDVDYEGWELETAETSHSMSTFYFNLESQSEMLLFKLNKALKRAGKKPIDGKPYVTLITSDTAESGANIYPYIQSEGIQIRIGKPLRTRHDGENTMSEFIEKCDSIYSLFQDATESLEKLLDVELTWPVETFLRVANEVDLPKKFAQAAAEEFDMERPIKCTAYDVYWALWKISLLSKNETIEQTIGVQEQIARALRLNFKDFDHQLSV